MMMRPAGDEESAMPEQPHDPASCDLPQLGCERCMDYRLGREAGDERAYKAMSERLEESHSLKCDCKRCKTLHTTMRAFADDKPLFKRRHPTRKY